MNTKRPKQLTFRVSPEEHKIIKDKITESGLNQQEFIIKAVTQVQINSNENIKELIPELKKIGVELKRQGNNFNQLVERLNSRGYIDYKKELPQTLSDLRRSQEELINIWQLLKQYLQKPR